MGRLTPHDCDHAKGLIALSVIGKLPEEERWSLVAHLDGCAHCQQDERDLKALSTALPAADLTRLDEESVPLDLSQSVLGRLNTEARREHRARRFRFIVGGAIAAGVAALGLVLGFSGSATSTTTVALGGTPGVHAVVRLTAESWGTSVHVSDTGQPGGQVLWVWMHTASGKWWEAGTFHSVSGRTVQVDLACALKLPSIDSVWVRNASGHTVLHGYVR